MKPNEKPQDICLDKVYHCYQAICSILAELGFTVHIRARGEEAGELAREAEKRARRWVVECVHSWISHFRRILIRWEKKPENYIVFLHFAYTLIAFRVARLVG